jgi:hypothetical protein
MYEYRILFPHLGSREIRRELNGDPRTGGDRSRSGGAYRAERPQRLSRREHA